MKVSFHTLGCRMNHFDTDLMRWMFMREGYEQVDFEEKADIYIINTCTVTTGGDRASRQAIYQAKRRNPKAIVVATGCYAQVKPQELLNLKEVDLVVGNTHKSEILKIVEEFLERRERKLHVGNIFRQKELQNFDLVLYFEGVRPFIKVQEGCNRFCTFCVIPFARGKVRSVPVERILQQVKLLADRGFKEVVITGTQLSQYGWDIGKDLHSLLVELLKVKGVEIFRLSSLHVGEINEKLLDLITGEERIAPHFHLSLQSGSDRILKLMERGYTGDHFRRVVEHIVSKRPYSSIGTDIIVGFPGETEKDFEETCRFVEENPFSYIHVFPYSDREGTKAFGMKPKVPSKVKKDRVKVLKSLDDRKREEFLRRCRGRTFRAVVIEEGRVLTENYIYLNRRTAKAPGELVLVKV